MADGSPARTSSCPVAPPGADRRARLRGWLKRLGVVGVLFFLAKGLIWLTVTYFLVTV